MGVSIVVKGINNVTRMLDNVNNLVDRKFSKGIRNATFYMEGEVKDSVRGAGEEGPFYIKYQRKNGEGPGLVENSVDTGRFLGSIKGKSFKRYGIVYSNLKYAKSLEYGTSKIKPRRHFRNTLARNQDNIKNIVRLGILK